VTIETEYEPHVTITKKGGMGVTHGAVSEYTGFVHVKPGTAPQLDAALKRFHERFRKAPMSKIQQIGLQDMRHVIFDNGTRMAWILAFDTNWDNYIDDAIAIMGIEHWLDFLQYIEEYTPAAGTHGKSIKDFLQSAQSLASGYSRAFPDPSIGQFKRALEVTKAFDKALDQPGAVEALKNPALKPLLDLASA